MEPSLILIVLSLITIAINIYLYKDDSYCKVSASLSFASLVMSIIAYYVIYVHQAQQIESLKILLKI